MVPRSHTILGLTLGAVAGALLGLSVLPFGLGWSGYGHLTALAYFLRPWIWLTTLLMALGGLQVTRSRHALEALKAFSLAGLLAGGIAAAVALEASPHLLAAAGLTGWLYGLATGLPLARLARGGRHAAPGDSGAPIADAGAAPADVPGPGPAPTAAAATPRDGLDGDAI